MAYATETYVVKGMRRDDSDLLFNGSGDSLSFAFDNLNMRFTTDVHTTSLVATQEKGNRQVNVYAVEEFFLEPEEYAGSFYNITSMPFRVVGYCVVDKYLILFGKCLANRTVTNHDGTQLVFSDGDDIIIRLEKGQNDSFYGWIVYHGQELDFRVDMPLETIGNVETNIIKKVYFVDGVHGPRCVNVVNSEGGNIANINMGYSLSLDDEFIVKREYTIIGNYPMGKVRFFYTYFNDTYSETAIVDWSPYFDCTLKNQGGSPDSQYKTQYAFRIKINNIDRQFKYVRIYMQHFTSPDPSVYTLKYIERQINDDFIDFVYRYDEQDAVATDRTYLDIKATNMNFIPYTLAEKDNRMFYGNIKRMMPSLEDVDFTDTAQMLFYDKYIGDEPLENRVVYKYQPDRTSFEESSSNYEYMGFRKGNWYRFGIIAQHQSGEWSDVLYITDAQCDKTSRTEVEYHMIWNRPIKPNRSKFFIPSARLVPNQNFYLNLQKLKNLGFKRIKPVCVVPTYQYRTVLTQGLSCPTLYKGGDRINLSNNTGRFAIPSWFFRPQPVFDIDSAKVFPHFGQNSLVYKADYPYTIRKISDLVLDGNIKTNGKWILNPDFTDDKYLHYNVLFREWRHGYSLPPKDRANAELQSSDFSINDYYYHEYSTGPSALFNGNSLNLFDFAYSNGQTGVYFAPSSSSAGQSWYESLIIQYGVLPWHDIYTTGYNDTVFVDESINTLNSPEIDYVFSSQVEPWFSNTNIEIAGFAQVTGSMANVSVQDNRLELDNSSGLIDADAVFDKVTGRCLFDVAVSDEVDNDAKTAIDNLLSTGTSHNSPFVPLAGPWWMDTMLVASFERANPVYSHSTEAIFPNGNIKDADNNLWSPSDPTLLSQGSVINNNNVKFLYRAFDQYVKQSERKCTLTTTFYGETNKRWRKDRFDVSVIGDSMYPYNDMAGTSNTFKKAILFSDHYINDNYNQTIINPTDYDSIATRLLSLSTIPLTWNTRRLTDTIITDMYWQDFEKNRKYLDRTYTFADRGIVSLEDNFYSTDVGSCLDPCTALSYGDFRLTFSYYFNPIFVSMASPTAMDNYYKLQNQPSDNSEYIWITHPFVLPHGCLYNGEYDYTGVPPYSIIDGSQRDWITKASIALLATQTLNNYRDCSLLDESLYYFRGSEFGCHYYAPGSTNFVGSYFDPYYAHVIYPFMTSSNTPFCGSSNAYRGSKNNRPEYNSSNSCLYSSCTNYIDIEPSGTTYSAYYHSPNLTHELRREPDLSGIPFVDSANTNITKLYSFDCSDNASAANVPTISHRTYTLTAAMKWYRGFKRLESSSNISSSTIKLVSTGVNLDDTSIMGNLLFSGYLPQFLTHTGLLSNNNSIYGESNLNYNFIMENCTNAHLQNNTKMADGTPVHMAINNVLNNDEYQLLELSYKSMPHIVYYNAPDSGNLGLMPQLYGGTQPRYDIFDTSDRFMPQFYYKEFIAETIGVSTNNVPAYVTNSLGWLKAAYPHTGHFEDYIFMPLARGTNNQPYWNSNLQLPLYPAQTEKAKIDVDFNRSRFVTKYSDGSSFNNEDYWIVPISNMYNVQYLQTNPYTSSGISPESWSWKMCGYTVKIDGVLAGMSGLRAEPVEYLEGDTYFQRYNCFKTVSKDTMYEYLWQPVDGEQNTAAPGVNDVTETASVMIESYVNLDGLYWDYNNTIDRKTSPLVHAFWNNSKQINPVYGIQNGLCDEFRQIDLSYYNSVLTHYPSMIIWSIQKHDGENEDSFGIVPATNRMLTSGECGAINKLLTWRDNIYCLQEHGLSILNWNAQVIQPTTTESTLSIYLSDSTRLQDVKYVSRSCGTLNKWSVMAGNVGFYWIDETLRAIFGYMDSGEGYGLTNLSENCGFKSWSNDEIVSDNCLWNASVFPAGGKSFKAHSDIESGDIYWSYGNGCLCYNERIGCFTSFYGYGRTPYKFNWLDSVYSVYANGTGESLWKDECEYTHMLYGVDVNAHIELLVNPAGQYDKVFNFIEYNAEAYNVNNPDIVISMFNPYTSLTVSNMYQYGRWDIDKQNTAQRFRVWRSALPREEINGHTTLNRIRSPWCKIKLAHDGLAGHPFHGSTENEYRDKLYYINVNYTIPEQPVKSTVRQ